MRRNWMAGTAAAVLGAAACGVVVGMAGGPVAGAATPQPHYSVAAGGTGFELSLGGTAFAGAGSSASAGTGAPVTAQGRGEVSPQSVATVQATAAAPGTTQTRPRTCAQPTSPFPAPLATVLSIGAACGAASAAMRATGMPTATGAGSVASLTLGPPPGTTLAADLKSLLPTSVTQGSSLAQKLQTALGSTVGTVLGHLPAPATTGLPLGTVLQQVAAATSNSSVTSLVSATIGPSTSTVTTTGSTVTAATADTGTTLSLLDGLGSGGGPLLTVDVGRAVTSAHADLSAGTKGAAATGAAVSVTFNPPTGGSKTVSVTPGQSQTFLTGTPLQSTVSVGEPSVTAGHGTASASGVDVSLAQGASLGAGGTGGITVVLGAATAKAAVTVPPPSAPVTTTPPTVVPSAPATLTGATTVHTGEPWSGPLPFALLGLSLLAGIGLVARRRLVAVAHLAGRLAGRGASPAGSASHHAAGPGLRDLLRSPSGSGSGPAAHSPGDTGPVDGEA